ncbi:unnamed protein product [Malus baccata var. baccata]
MRTSGWNTATSWKTSSKGVDLTRPSSLISDDNFGVPQLGGSFDFFSKYSISGHLGRSRNVNSVTLQLIDSTITVGLRGPTNLFAHPIDQLLAELDTHLSQWDSRSQELLSKISFGHFPLSFSATSNSWKSLKDIFLNHSISAYICGHLHSRFGRNLKRRHLLSHHFLSLQKFFQLNVHRPYFHSAVNCSTEAPAAKEFWEWEMGEWKRSRAMRILAIDRGHVSYVDIDFKSGTKGQSSCQLFPWTHGSLRALVFSVSPIASITTKIYDSRPGFLYLVFEAPMHMIGDNTSRGDLFVGPWNHRAFDDPVPNRYWLQIEATDFMGRSTLSDLRPFSVNGLTTTISWTWKEFMVMGCQWAALIYPMLWCAVYFILCVLLIPKAILIFSVRHFTYKNKGFVNAIGLVFQELCKLPVAWFGFLGYLFYLILFPWFIGQVFTDGKDKGYMTYMGWVVKSFNQNGKHKDVGSPDVMVVVLPHLVFVVFPALTYMQEKCLEPCNHHSETNEYEGTNQDASCVFFAIAYCTNNCRTLVKAYEMNPVLHFPGYSLTIPLLLAYSAYKTRSV